MNYAQLKIHQAVSFSEQTVIYHHFAHPITTFLCVAFCDIQVGCYVLKSLLIRKHVAGTYSNIPA